MTEEELEELINDCPTLYHMAERGAWESIKNRGLLSTSALLDLYEVNGAQRLSIESHRRPECVELTSETLPIAVVRDQLPMDDAGLRRCLPEHLTPSDWYRLLNAKVFFWLTRDRLHRLTGAKAYREKTHDVTEVNTRSIVHSYSDKIWLCPINSGCTKPMPHPRDESVFSRIDEYPYDHWRPRRKRGERVVELAVDHSVPDISIHVVRVSVMQGLEVLEVLFP